LGKGKKVLRRFRKGEREAAVAGPDKKGKGDRVAGKKEAVPEKGYWKKSEAGRRGGGKIFQEKRRKRERLPAGKSRVWENGEGVDGERPSGPARKAKHTTWKRRERKSQINNLARGHQSPCEWAGGKGRSKQCPARRTFSLVNYVQNPDPYPEKKKTTSRRKEKKSSSSKNEQKREKVSVCLDLPKKGGRAFRKGGRNTQEGFAQGWERTERKGLGGAA